ncbi:MAG: PEP-CTERM sorting domain-containing protein [Phycisphaerales bacterium]
MKAASLFALAGALGVASATQAEVSAAFSFDDLAGSYTQSSSTSGTFSAVAVDTINLQTAGDASRLIPTEGNAVFEAGFVSGANPADFQISISVNIDAPNHAVGSGSFTFTDADGDTITGDISGEWVLVGSFLAFSGNLTNIFLNDNGANDNMFNGTDGSSTDWSMSFPGSQPFEGALVNLVFGATNFFGSNFSDRSTGVTAQIVPAPGALALVGLGGLAAARRRR